MAKSTVVLRNLADLAAYFPIDDLPDQPLEEGTPPPCSVVAAMMDADDVADSPRDLPALLAQLTAASATLADLAQQDQAARQAAQGLLEHYEALRAEHQQAEQTFGQAQRVRQEAEALAAHAFVETARRAAAEVMTIAEQAEAVAAKLMEQRRAAYEMVAAEPALARILEERRQEDERQQAEAAEAERTRRLQEGLAAAKATLAAGMVEEAEAMLGELAKDLPNSADVTSFQDSIRLHRDAVKINAAAKTLHAARRSYRHSAADAIAQLEQLDLTGLPEHLLQQLKGVWAAACARLCREQQVTGLLRYLPLPAYGVVVAREAEGAYRVISALGASHLPAGSVVAESFVQRARPLRSTGR